jgi:1-deoxy-D-xylulose-5-phosphate synthase
MFLENIRNPGDLKRLSINELGVLCKEIRQRIIEVVSICGGHLASSLGTVELIVALHYCLDLPQDKIIFDVGHQAYTHKILTGRNERFSTLRQYSGISGFPCKDESIYDPFTTGHSSTAISLALGLVCAKDLLKDASYKVVAVIGDGSLSGGLCFEGLNNAGHLKKDLLVVLNTNELSISPNVGALSTYINKIISLPIYNRFRQALEEFIKNRLPKGKRILKLVDRFEEALKGLFIPGMFFEELGFRYFGPIDGHNLEILIPTLKNILSLSGPRLLHVVTKKGKGYLPAEENPVKFHSALPFEIETGKPKVISQIPTYTEIFSKKLVELAKKDSRIVAITAAMPEGTGLDRFRDNFPERFFDVGIAEEHAVCFAGGLAKAGLKPVVAIYSTFLQRAYDQIIEEICLQNLGVILTIDRAGIVGEDGPTHQGVLDIAYLRNLPNLVVMAPKGGKELEMMLEFAISLDKPVAIRYPKDKLPIIDHQLPNAKLELGKAEILKEAKDFLVIALGSMVIPAWEAIELLEKEGLFGGLINTRFVKPLDGDLFKKLSSQINYIFTVEEGVLEGGFGSAVMEVMDRSVIRIGLPSEFIPQGKREILLDKYNLTAKAIRDKIKSIILSR